LSQRISSSIWRLGLNHINATLGKRFGIRQWQDHKEQDNAAAVVAATETVAQSDRRLVASQ